MNRSRMFMLGLTVVLTGFGLAVISHTALAAPFTTGDVFVGVGDGFIKEFSRTGTLVQTLDTGFRGSEDTGMAFDPQGNMYATVFTANTMVKFNNNGVKQGASFGSGFNQHPESIALDGAGNMFVGQADGSKNVLKFDLAGNPGTPASFTVATGPRGTDWTDLKADKHTIRYTSEGNIIREFDLATSTQLANFVTGPVGAEFVGHRILPNGGDLVADFGKTGGNNLIQYDASGNVVKTYSIPNEPNTFAANLDPDGKTFWTAGFNDGIVYQIDLATGNILEQFNAGRLGASVAGLAVFGEITVGCPECGVGGPSGVPEPATLLFLSAGFVGLGLRTCRRHRRK